jgi:SAM-dependent methyltransferase
MDAPDRNAAENCLLCGDVVEVNAGIGQCRRCGLSLTHHADGLLGTLNAGVTASDAIAYPEEASDLTLRIEETSFWFRHRNRAIAALFERFAPTGPLWDIGGGNGFQARFLQEKGQPVVVVEPGIAGCRNALARGVRNVVCSTLQALRLPDGRVPAISLFDVLEHVADPKSMLAECRRVLKPGGLLYLTVPAYRLLWSDEDVYARHERRYTRPELRSALEQAGFDVVYVGYYFRILVLPILFLRSLPFRLRRSPAGQTPAMDASDHTPSAAARVIVDRLLAGEISAIRRGREMPFGSSVIAVAVASEN